jgi:hypothetical protein
MRSFTRNALLGAAGLVAMSLSAHAAGSTAVTDTPLLKSTTATKTMQMARDENPGGGGAYKKSKKKKKKTTT